MNSKVTIVVPVYNAEKYIHKCIQSLLDQTYKNLEIILVDDESPDRCPQICDEYAAKDQRVRTIHQKNTGASGARKHGIEQASGARIAFADADDWMLPSMIEEMVEAAEKNAADIVICDWTSFSNDEERGERQTQTLKNTSSMEQIRDEFLMDRHLNFMWNKLYDRKLFAGIQHPSNIVLQDLYINAEIFCHCRKVYYIPKPLYCYRIHASFSKTQPKIYRKYGGWLAWQEHERVCEKYGLTKPLRFSRLRAQQLVISLLTMNHAEPMLEPEQEKNAKKYLYKCKKHPADDLSLKHKIEWWALENVPAISFLFGRLSLWAEAKSQKRKYNK